MKKIGLLLIFWSISFCGIAQVLPESQEMAKKKIRELKLSELYFYAEAVVPSNALEAEQNAKDLLNIHIAGILTGEYDMKKKEAEKRWNAVADKCESIAITTGILHKVFTCVPKSLVVPHQEEKKNIQKPAVDESKELFVMKSRSLSDKDEDYIKKLTDQGGFKEVLAFLEKSKKDQKVKYGSLQTCEAFDKVYLIIFKDGKMETILGMGTDKRENLKTGTQASVMDYMGCSIIWFQIL